MSDHVIYFLTLIDLNCYSIQGERVLMSPLCSEIFDHKNNCFTKIKERERERERERARPISLNNGTLKPYNK